ncbi:MAG: hypothetical protein NUV81_02360 [bacterium]|nr:hypothetical protein [bacterium]
MANSVRVVRASRNSDSSRTCCIEARARIFSFGGLLLLVLSCVVTGIFYLSLTQPNVTGVQQLIAFVLFVGSWAYFVNGITERIHLTGKAVVFCSALGRTRAIPLTELEDLALRHQGFNLDRGFEIVEFRIRGRDIETFALGPCWSRANLDNLILSLQNALDQTT